MGYALPLAEELGVPTALLWTSGTGSLICFDQFDNLIQKGLMPLKDPSDLVNGYLDTVIDFIPSMPGIPLKYIPTFVRMLNPGDEYMVEFNKQELERAKKATAVIFNTFNELEYDILETISLKYTNCLGIGPLHMLENNNVDKSLESIKTNLWKEEPKCLEWLDSKEPLSVIYVNFGSITVMNPQQLAEFCWGLAKSNQSFLWVIRPDLVGGDSVALPPEFLAETSNRGMLVSWCSQEKVLSHPSVGGFSTHCGWNSTLESISYGVPMICWPFFTDQLTNCWLSCNKWKVALEIDNNVKRDEVSKLVIELMNGEKGKEMRKNAIDLKNKAEASCKFPSGSSVINLEKLINLLQSSSK
ncbi:7-deoxyloganetin glucosyltransferase-like [Bidens hawaiensis]|uniref:7-deoxyloganetin glucosyltransferase-like n=1 Tax=Bidens hawaiensis TaxID=980011 RepID=UPI00404B1C2C